MNEPTYADLAAGLHIDEHALDEAWVNQADLYHHVSKRLSTLVSLRDEAKSVVADIEAQLSVMIRENMRKKDEKYAEGEIASRIRNTPKMKEANERLLKLNKEVGKYTALEKDYSQRSFALNKLVDLYTAGYFSEGVRRSSSHSMKDHDAANARAKMNRVRRQKENDA